MARTKRSEVDRALLSALACGATVENAARKAGVTVRTVYRRLADPSFCKQVQQMRNEMSQRTFGLLTAAGMGSVKTLVDLQQDVTVAAAVRRGAARDILELGLKLREAVGQEERLAALEARLANAPGNGPEDPARDPTS